MSFIFFPSLEHIGGNQVTFSFGFDQEMPGIGRCPAFGIFAPWPICKSTVTGNKEFQPLDSGLDVILNHNFFTFGQGLHLVEVQLGKDCRDVVCSIHPWGYWSDYRIRCPRLIGGRFDTSRMAVLVPGIPTGRTELFQVFPASNITSWTLQTGRIKDFCSNVDFNNIGGRITYRKSRSLRYDLCPGRFAQLRSNSTVISAPVISTVCVEGDSTCRGPVVLILDLRPVGYSCP